MKLPLSFTVCPVLTIVVVALANLTLGVGDSRAGDAAAGQARYSKICINCHGKAGKGMASFPSLQGRDADYISGRLMKYRAKEKVGPNVKFHHSKINAKLPGGQTAVKWHQDFPFTPHSNDDLVTALLMVDEVTEENGPLEVVAGSHRVELHGLWHDGVFTGAGADEIAEDCRSRAISCTGSAGSVCLMHTRLLHASAPNLSPNQRNLFICVYSAEDAVSYSANPMPTKYEGLVVRGEKTNRVRSIPYQIELPQKPTTASFFDQQVKHGENASEPA